MSGLGKFGVNCLQVIMNRIDSICCTVTMALTRGFALLHKDDQWYLVQCKPREGFRTEQHLVNQYFECFHPTHSMKRKISGAVRSFIELFFPDYLFGYLTNASNSVPIHSTLGVSKIVHFNGYPAVLNSIVMQQLRMYYASLQGFAGYFLRSINNPVVIIDGYFKEMAPIVTTVSGDDYVTLLLNMFNRPHNVELHYSAVVGL